MILRGGEKKNIKKKGNGSESKTDTQRMKMQKVQSKESYPFGMFFTNKDKNEMIVR